MSFANPKATTDDPAGRKRVALVIDDGPIPGPNAVFLALFARERVRATFSSVGQNVAAHPELCRALVAAGHEINNHSYAHPHLQELTDADIGREVVRTTAAIQGATGQAPAWFWAPYLEHDDRVDAAVRRAGLEHFPLARYRFIDSLDWEPRTTGEKFLQLTTSGITDGTVILMHEWPEVTLANLPALIVELKRQGVEFVTFSELTGK